MSGSGMNSHAILVGKLKDNKIIQRKAVEDAMSCLDRGLFCTQEPYEDRPVRIGFGATISAPHMHAFALDALADKLVSGSNVLDLGSGSGYLTAALGKMVAPEGKVTGVEHIPELVDMSIKNINAAAPELIRDGIVEIKLGDGREGCPEKAPFDAIHVGAAVECVPQQLLDQLKVGGRLIVPVGSKFGGQTFRQYDKRSDDDIASKDWFGVRYIPLTSVEQQMSGRPCVDMSYSGYGTLDMLNDDTLHIIFGYLSLNERLIAEQVCQKWQQLLLRRWKALEKVDLASLMGIIYKRGPCISQHPATYRMHTLPQFRLKALAKRCGPALHTMESGGRFNLELDSVALIARDFPGLCYLDLSDAVLTPSIDSSGEPIPGLPQSLDNLNFQNIRELNLDSCFDEGAICYYDAGSAEDVLHKVFSSMPVLEDLSVGYNTLIEGPCLLALNPSSLRRLNLAFCRRINTDILYHVFTHLRSLEDLSIYSHHRVEGSCLSVLQKGLRAIDLSFCDSLTTRAISEFIEGHPSIRTMKLSHLLQINNTVLKELRRLEQVEVLELTTYYPHAFYPAAQFSIHATDIVDGLRSLRHLNSLTSLDLTNNEFVTDEILEVLCSSLIRLKRFVLAGIPGLTNTGFYHLCALSELDTLDVSKNHSIDCETLLSIAFNTNLKTLIARSCHYVTAESIKLLRDSWPAEKETILQIY